MDYAANALQVERAKHFRELLGNYSRWGFYHPGPAFFYIYALGEKVLHDWIHLVPSEMNAHVVSIILVNTAFLFGCISIVGEYCRSRLFPPVALGLSLFFIYVVNVTIPGSAIVSIWPPYVLMFCFLFFITASASVASGKAKHLVWMSLSGLLLIHGHVAQPLFVGVLAVCTLASLWWKRGRAIGLRAFFFELRKPLAISLVLVLLFSLPILLDIALHTDNNVRAILHHAELHPGAQHSALQALQYEYSFLTFAPHPEQALTHLTANVVAHKYVAVYWAFGLFLFATVLVLYRNRWSSIPFFIRFSVFEILLTAVLFFYWTLKMTGPLFNFNGYFFYSVQLSALLVGACLILNRVDLTVRRWVVLLLCALLPLSMFASAGSFRSIEWGDDETTRAIASLPPYDGKVIHFTFATRDWRLPAGVGNWMKHNNRPFCVDDLWAFPFGRDYVCRQFDGLTNLVFARLSQHCQYPCRILMHDQQFELQLQPYPAFKLPFVIRPDDLGSLNKGFNEGLGTDGPVWSRGSATMFFRLADSFTDAEQVRVRIYGKANPDRPVGISLNGHAVGVMTATEESKEFVIPRNWLRPQINQLTLQVENPLQVPGDPQNNPRVMGFLFSKAEFEPVSQNPAP